MERANNHLTRSGATDHAFTEAVERACYLAATSDEVASVLVVPGRRPSYDELLLIRESVAFMALDLTVQADGSVAVRRTPRIERAAEHDTPLAPIRLLVATEHKAMATIEHVRSGIVGWNAGFSELAEGTR